MLTHANGECCDSDSHGGDNREPLSAIEAPYSVSLGMAREEHAEDCLFRTEGDNAPGDYECECERNTYSTSPCKGCGSYLHGERHAMTLWGPEDPDRTRSCGCGATGIHGVDHDD
jgi:hypothetical protein